MTQSDKHEEFYYWIKQTSSVGLSYFIDNSYGITPNDAWASFFCSKNFTLDEIRRHESLGYMCVLVVIREIVDQP